MLIADTDVASFLDLARNRLRAAPPEPGDPLANLKGDHQFEHDAALYLPEGPPKLAAVLVPVLPLREAQVVLTRRSQALRSHSGQIAFPGGRVDDEDAGPLDTALREAEEEIGLDRRHVTPIGFGDAYLSGTNYLVTPVVALVDPEAELTLNPLEVDEAFRVPLSFLMDPGNHRLQSLEWKGRRRHFYEIPFEERYIWGVTAGIIRNLYERLYAP
jgi:8-oxo-dGTP pyrophosphatase MutT (NUDIX family)